MKPTPHIAWLEANDQDEEGPCAITARGYSFPHWKLVQWWEYDSGNGEWRSVVTTDGKSRPDPA